MSSRPHDSVTKIAGVTTASACGAFGVGPPTYALGHSQRELKRLTFQARLFDPFTRRVFEQAGLAQGMRILDVGSGNGDVALLAATFVGASGEVLGIDRAPAAVQAANARAQAAGLHAGQAAQQPEAGKAGLKLWGTFSTCLGVAR